MTLTNYLRSGVAALAVAAVVPAPLSAQTISPSTAHPLLSLSGDDYAVFVGNVGKTMSTLSQNEGASTRAGGFITALQAALKENRDKPRTLVYPNNPILGQLSVVAVLPPTEMKDMPIGVCLQEGIKAPGKDELVHTNVGTFQIKPDGSVVTQAWNGVKVGGNDASGKFQAACAPYRSAYIQYINETRMAQAPAVPLPAGATIPPVSSTAATATVATAGAFVRPVNNIAP